MKDPIVEYVAKALAEADGNSWRNPPYNHLHTDALNNKYRYLAKKAIDALANAMFDHTDYTPVRD